MEREKAIRLLQKEIDALCKNIQEDPDLDEEKRASLLESANGLRDQLNSNSDGDEHLHLLLSLFGYDGATIDDEDGERDDGDALATLAGSAPATTGAGSLPIFDESAMWGKIRSILVDTMELKHILYSDGEDDYYTDQFGMGDGEGRQLVMKVIYTPDADCIQFRAGYPFNVDRSVLPIARSFICKRNYEMRYTRIELDARDGEVYICLVMRVEDPAEPPASFVRMLNLTISTGFDEYDTLRRYSRAQFTDEERAEFLAEVELISPLMLE